MVEKTLIFRFATDAADAQKQVQAFAGNSSAALLALGKASDQTKATLANLGAEAEVAQKQLQSSFNIDKAVSTAIGKITDLQGRLGSLKDRFTAGQGTALSDIFSQFLSAGSLSAFTAASGGILGVSALMAGVVAQQTEHLAELKQAAQAAGVTVEQLTGLQTMLTKLGVSSGDTSGLLARLVSSMLEAKNGGTGMADAFRAAGISVTDANGALRPTVDVLQDIERYLRGTGDEAAKTNLVTQALGQQLGGEFSEAVKKGGVGMDNMAASARALGSSMANDLASGAAAAVNAVKQVYEKVDQYYTLLKKVGHFDVGDAGASKIAQLNLDQAISARDALTRRYEDYPGHISDAFGGGASSDFKVDPAALAAANKKVFDAAAAIQPVPLLHGTYPGEVKPTPPAPATTPPAAVVSTTGGGGSSSRRSAGGGDSGNDRVDTVTDDLARQVAAEKALAGALGATDAERERGLAMAKAEEAASERGSALTDQERQQIIQLADAYTAAKQKIDDFKQKQEQAKEQAQFFGQTFEQAVEGVATQGNRLSDVMKQILQALESAAIKAAILGQGPLASLFGTAAAPSATGVAAIGGLFGKALGGFKGFFAGGGSIPSGGWGVAGERGPEIIHGPATVVPNISVAALSGPGRAVSVTHAPNFNIVAAPGMSEESVARMIARGQEQSNRDLGMRLARWTQRYG